MGNGFTDEGRQDIRNQGGRLSEIDNVIMGNSEEFGEMLREIPKSPYLAGRVFGRVVTAASAGPLGGVMAAAGDAHHIAGLVEISLLIIFVTCF